MKKLILMLIIIAIVIMGNTYEVFLFAKKVLLGEPATYTIQQGEYLSEIAQKYYGDAKYWKELALVNRAPNSNLIFPGEEIVIPRKEVILNIRKAKSLSDVNKYVRGEEDIIARLQDYGEVETIVAETEPEPVKADIETEIVEPVASYDSETQPLSIEQEEIDIYDEPVKSSSLSLVLAILAVLLVGGIITMVVYIKKKRAKFDEEFAILRDTEIDENDKKDKNEKDEQDIDEIFEGNRVEEKEVIIT